MEFLFGMLFNYSYLSTEHIQLRLQRLDILSRRKEGRVNSRAPTLCCINRRTAFWSCKRTAPIQAGTMYRYYLVILLTCSLHLVFADWPEEDECREEDDHGIKCTTSDPMKTIGSLPLNVSRLLLILGPDLSHHQLVSFSNLTELRTLMIDYNAKTHPLAGIDFHDDAFRNITKLEVFRSRASTGWIGASQFHDNMKLTEIMLSHANLTWDDFSIMTRESFANKATLTTIRLRSFSTKYNRTTASNFNPKEIFGPLANLTVKHLDLASNGLYSMPLEMWKVFSHLEYLDISYNMLCYPDSPSSARLQYPSIPFLLQNLKFIDFSHQGNFESYQSRSTIQDSPVNCSMTQNRKGTVHAYQSNTTSCCSGGIEFPFGKVEFVLGSQILPPAYPWPVKSYHLPCLCIQPNNNVKHVDFSENAFLFEQLPYLESLLDFNMNAVRVINLQNCHIKKTALLRSLPALRVAYLAGNMLGTSMEDDQTFELMNNSKLLQVLDLADNGIQHFPGRRAFENFHELTHLNLSDNLMSDWDADIVHLLNLTTFNLSGNGFATLSKLFRDQLENLTSLQRLNLHSEGVVVVDLSRNPLSCLCLDLEFLSWLQTTKVNFYNKDKYECIHPRLNKVKLQSVDLGDLHNYCFPSSWKVIVMSVSITSVSTMLVVALITVYCKRWHLRYWWYLLHQGWRRHQDEHDENEYQYDVFVAHSTEDAEWVTGPLFEELETKRGFRLCLYQRDIHGNEILMQAIVEKISMSRRTLLVLSPNFVMSNWCQFELHIAHAKLGEEGKDVIVSAILKALPNHEVNKTLYNLLKRKVYFEWPSEREGQDLFWDQLASALRPPTTHTSA